jgi:hypothetical protein
VLRADRNQILLDRFHSGGEGADDEAELHRHDSHAQTGEESDQEPHISGPDETAK